MKKGRLFIFMSFAFIYQYYLYIVLCRLYPVDGTISVSSSSLLNTCLNFIFPLVILLFVCHFLHLQIHFIFSI